MSTLRTASHRRAARAWNRTGLDESIQKQAAPARTSWWVNCDRDEFSQRVKEHEADRARKQPVYLREDVGHK